MVYISSQTNINKILVQSRQVTIEVSTTINGNGLAAGNFKGMHKGSDYCNTVSISIQNYGISWLPHESFSTFVFYLCPIFYTLYFFLYQYNNYNLLT